MKSMQMPMPWGRSVREFARLSVPHVLGADDEYQQHEQYRSLEMHSGPEFWQMSSGGSVPDDSGRGWRPALCERGCSLSPAVVPS